MLPITRGQGRIGHSASLPKLHMSNSDTCQRELSICTLDAATAVFRFLCRRLCWTSSLRNTCAGQLSRSSQSHSYHSTGHYKLQTSNSLPSRSQRFPPPLLSNPTATQTHRIGMVKTHPLCVSCQIRVPQMNVLARARPSAVVIKIQTGLIRGLHCSPHGAYHNGLVRTRQGSSVRTNRRCLITIQEEYLIRICYSPCSGAPHSRSQTPSARLM